MHDIDSQPICCDTLVIISCTVEDYTVELSWPQQYDLFTVIIKLNNVNIIDTPDIFSCIINLVSTK